MPEGSCTFQAHVDPVLGEIYTIRVVLGLYWSYIRVILGLYWGYIRVILGIYWGYVGIMEKKMETTCGIIRRQSEGGRMGAPKTDLGRIL